MATNIKFGTDGWRAIIAEDFTFDNVKLVTKAIGAYAKKAYGDKKPVIIGYDTRFMADKFARASAEILNKMGLNVMLTSSHAPTPVVAYAAKNLQSAGALMFTASHNPPEYCGIKYIPDYAGPATKDITDQIVQNVENISSGTLKVELDQKSNTKLFDPKQDYFDAVKKLIDLNKIADQKIGICFDPLYATSLGYFDEILKQFGCDIKMIHDWKDPLYGGGMPEPKEKYLGELKALVMANPRSVGFSNDGDADRFGVLDENGNYVCANYIIALLLKHLVKNKNRKGIAVRNIGTSLMVDKVANMLGVEVKEVPVGFKWVGEIMRSEQVIIGGEESGGLSIWGHIPEKDGIIANLSVLEAMAYEQKPLCQMIEELKQEIGTDFINKMVNLKLNESVKSTAMNKFRNDPPQMLGGLKITSKNLIDGVKYYLEDGNTWILIRPSGTEPLLRISVETDCNIKMDAILKDIDGVIENLK